MVQFECLPVSFFDRPVLEVARQLLGMRLTRLLGGYRLAGMITETEAYRGEEDLACHARAGKTPRTVVMYGPPGRAYIYFTYGMHWMLNCVTGPEGFPAAVLIRGMLPVEGLEWIAARRSDRRREEWCNGPAKICQALDIDGRLNRVDLTTINSGLWIELDQGIPESQVTVGPRVGMQTVPEPWKSMPWRFVAHPDGADG